MMATTNFADQIDRFLTGQMVKEEQELFKQVLRGVANTIRMRREETADLEQRLAEATGDGWTYIEDQEPQPHTDYEVSVIGISKKEYVTNAFFDPSPGMGWRRVATNGELIWGTVYAYRPLPQPAPIRAGSTEQAK